MAQVDKQVPVIPNEQVFIHPPTAFIPIEYTALFPVDKLSTCVRVALQAPAQAIQIRVKRRYEALIHFSTLPTTATRLYFVIKRKKNHSN
jgi:hypothetical protein